MAKTFQLAEAERRIEQLEEQLGTARNELQFMASTEKGKLRAVNAQLLSALEQATLFIEGVFPEPSSLLKQELAFYRAAIEEARK